jgi:DNA-binding LacI/PurR family transcriptional regulator
MGLSHHIVTDNQRKIKLITDFLCRAGGHADRDLLYSTCLGDEMTEQEYNIFVEALKDRGIVTEKNRIINHEGIYV